MTDHKSCLERLAIVLPSLDPDRKFDGVVQGLVDAGFAHIVIVDDGSDEAHQAHFERAAAHPCCRVLHHGVNKGKGRALKTAFRCVLDEYPEVEGVVTIDGDGQHLLDDIIACGEKMLELGDAVVLGIGLNVNEPQNREGVDPAASYVTYVANIKRLDTADFGREFLEQFYALYEQWLTEGFAPLKDEFNDAMLLSGRTMEVVDALGNSLAKGIAQGVDERGYLLLEREDGSVQAVASGEVHVLC